MCSELASLSSFFVHPLLPIACTYLFKEYLHAHVVSYTGILGGREHLVHTVAHMFIFLVLQTVGFGFGLLMTSFSD